MSFERDAKNYRIYSTQLVQIEGDPASSALFDSVALTVFEGRVPLRGENAMAAASGRVLGCRIIAIMRATF